MKKFLTILMVLIVIALGAAGIGYYWYNSQVNNAISSESQVVDFKVTSGDSTAVIAKNLEEKGLIGNAFVFQTYVRLNDVSGFKAGDFELNKNMNIPQIAATLQTVPLLKQVKVLVREGERFNEIMPDIEKQLAGSVAPLTSAKLLDIANNPDKYMAEFSTETQTFLNTHKPAGKHLEGFLYPDTYFIDKTFTEVKLVDLLVRSMAQKVKDAGILSEGKTFYDQLIIASILEREANNEVDYPIVAGIFYNRIRQGMRLDSDVTLLYWLNRNTPEPTAPELRDTSNPYNTRALLGLTPTPINNPGIATIKAAANPTPNDYLFFIAGNDGKMYYAKTYSEHNRNISRYL